MVIESIPMFDIKAQTKAPSIFQRIPAQAAQDELTTDPSIFKQTKPSSGRLQEQRRGVSLLVLFRTLDRCSWMVHDCTLLQKHIKAL